MPKIKKERASKVKDIHPNSRKAGQIVRQEHHKEKVERRKAERDALQNAKCKKIQWFSSKLPESCEKLSQQEMTNLIEGFLSRFDDELQTLQEDLSSVQHKGTTSQSKRNEKLKTLVDHERHLFAVGAFEAPDMTCAKTVQVLRNWDGKKEQLQNIKMRKFKRAKYGDQGADRT